MNNNKLNNIEERVSKIEEKIDDLNVFLSMSKFNREELMLLHKHIFESVNTMKDNENIKQSLLEGKHKYKIVNNLKEIINSSLYNQKKIAEILNINEKTLSNIVTNRYNPSLEVVLKLSILLGKTVNEMFTLEIIEE
jgi:putative transcriptional regulator